jgi:hypothetical protein
MPNVVVRPQTSARWGDPETIFNARGCSVARGCWCMFYRNSGADATLPKGVTRAAANCNEHKALVDAGVTWAKRRGVRVREAYPVDRAGRSRDDAMWFGARSMYAAAGFVEVARRKADRPVVRLTVR